MARRKGICHLCGKGGLLTFEHVPPRAAFNDHPVLLATMSDYLAGDGKRRESQRGFGAWTLCGSCNSSSGAWYAPELIRWCRTGMEVLWRVPVGAREITITFFNVYPLRLIKQVATMFFSANPPPFHKIHEELARLILNRDQTGLPDGYDFRLTLFRGPIARQTGVVGIFNVDAGRIETVSEIARPPFAYNLFFDGAPEGTLGYIGHFGSFGYDQRTDITVTLAVGEGHTPYPRDFRRRGEVLRDGIESELQALGFGLKSGA